MATKNRPGFFRVALACFQRQTHPRTELIVVDDGEQPVEELCAGQDRVRYIRLTEPTFLGTKLNLGIEASRGDVIQKLDDDDYYGPRFLETACAHLARGEGGNSLAAWDCFLVLHPRERRLRYSGHGWKAGGTLCFPHSMWQRKGFRDVPRSVDSWFLHDHRPEVVRVCEPEQYILVRHGANTWTQMQGGIDTDDFLRTRRVHDRGLRDIVDAEALSFYDSLAAAPL